MNTRFLIVIILIMCGVVGLFGWFVWNREHRSVPAIVAPTPTSAISWYDGGMLRLKLVAGWKATVVDSSGYPGAVNVRKGKYILYINPRAQQASGVEGGRFSEIAMGAPSIDAVITEHPVPPCNEPVRGGAYGTWVREDLYVDANTTAAWCRKPPTDKSVWYFSYITTEVGGYFNYYEAGEPIALVVTAAYDSMVLSELPERGSSELERILGEVGQMAETISIIKP